MMLLEVSWSIHKSSLALSLGSLLGYCAQINKDSPAVIPSKLRDFFCAKIHCDVEHRGECRAKYRYHAKCNMARQVSHR